MAARAGGDLERARGLLSQAVDAVPDAIRYIGNLGNVLQELGDIEGALACHDRVIALSDGLAIAHFNRGNALSTLGRMQLAAAAYERALAREPGHGRAAGALGRTR